jgi:hypothetical protein
VKHVVAFVYAVGMVIMIALAVVGACEIVSWYG